MRLRWFKKLKYPIQILFGCALILVLLIFYIPLSKYIKPTIASLLAPPLKFSEGLSANAKDFFQFQDLAAENKRLKAKLDQISVQLVNLQEADAENQRLREVLSLPQRTTMHTCVALVIGKDSSNWSNIVMINKGSSSGLSKGMPVVLGETLVGQVIESAPEVSKVALIVDFNSKIPAQIARTREQGLVFGGLEAGRAKCKMKYIQDPQVKDKVVSSGLGKIYPKGLLIGEVIKVESEQEGLYKIAQIKPSVDFAHLEEVMVIVGQ